MSLKNSIRSQLNDWQDGDIRIIPSFRARYDKTVSKNPIKLLSLLSLKSWLFFFSGWFAWTCDGYDYFCVSLTANQLAIQFNTDIKNITTAITLTLLFRSIGAVVFGVLADRFGRKWTLISNLLLIAVFELGSGFCQTLQQFLAVRSLFGVAMGGIWGQAAATALENVDPRARGMLSGILQQGYSVGYLLAAAINIGVVQRSQYGWRSIYFIGAGFSCSAAIVRSLLPESESFILARQEAKASQTSQKEATRIFLRSVGQMLRQNWLRTIWAICLMTGLNFLAHASQDLYPTYLQTTKHLSTSQSSLATIIMNVGAIVGGAIAGYTSQYVGRRLAIMFCIIWAAVFIPLWILPSAAGALSAGAFFIQSGVQGALGVIPIYLGEISPPAFRASFAGLVYQLGNAASAGAAEIEADAGKTMRVEYNGTTIPDYAKIMGIMIGAIMAWVLIVVLLGPEADGSHFEQARTAAQERRTEDVELDEGDKVVVVHQEVASKV